MSTKPLWPGGRYAPSPSERESTMMDPGTPPPPDAAAAAAAVTLVPGVPARIGRFEVREVLGAGAFGRVYRGFDAELRRDVAIKVPKPEALSADFRERFLREARAAATIRHPNVCPVYEVGTDDGVPYIVMGFVPGRTLAQVIAHRRGPFPAKQAVGIVRRLALAVEAAHRQGVVHRDLKPGNVLVDKDRKDVMVTDFGLAKLLGDVDGASTLQGDVLGTPAYMAPEQARGEVERVGPLSDVYSLGVILYELLTGQTPFRGTVSELLGQVLGVEPRSAAQVLPGLDPRLDAICRKAMAKDPARRFASARELATALGDVLRGADGASAAGPAAATEPTPAPEVGYELQASGGLAFASFAEEAVPEAAAAPTDAYARRELARLRDSQRKTAARVQWVVGAAVVVVLAALSYGAVRMMQPEAVPKDAAPAAGNKPRVNAAETPRPPEWQPGEPPFGPDFGPPPHPGERGGPPPHPGEPGGPPLPYPGWRPGDPPYPPPPPGGP